MKDTDVSIEPIGTDCTLKFTVKPAIPAAQYKAVGTNGENELEQTAPYGTDGYLYLRRTDGRKVDVYCAGHQRGWRRRQLYAEFEKTKVEPPYLDGAAESYGI